MKAVCVLPQERANVSKGPGQKGQKRAKVEHAITCSRDRGQSSDSEQLWKGCVVCENEKVVFQENTPIHLKSCLMIVAHIAIVFVFHFFMLLNNLKFLSNHFC